VILETAPRAADPWRRRSQRATAEFFDRRLAASGERQ